MSDRRATAQRTEHERAVAMRQPRDLRSVVAGAVLAAVTGMSRFVPLAVSLLTACGTDHEPFTDAGVIVAPDGSIISPDDGAHPPGDGPEALTVCEQAAQHSDLPWIQAHVFTPSCASSSCHGGPEPEVGLSLADGVARANLVDKGSSTKPGWIRVVPGAPSSSYLLVSLGRVPGPPPQDGFMPLGTDEPLCAPKIEAIERWIQAGAPP